MTVALLGILSTAVWVYSLPPRLGGSPGLSLPLPPRFGDTVLHRTVYHCTMYLSPESLQNHFHLWGNLALSHSALNLPTRLAVKNKLKNKLFPCGWTLGSQTHAVPSGQASYCSRLKAGVLWKVTGGSSCLPASGPGVMMPVLFWPSACITSVPCAANGEKCWLNHCRC